MRIWLNGDAKEIPPMSTIQSLLIVLNQEAARVAVEVNGSIARRGSHAMVMLSEGDRVEVVSFVGGG